MSKTRNGNESRIPVGSIIGKRKDGYGEHVLLSFGCKPPSFRNNGHNAWFPNLEFETVKVEGLKPSMSVDFPDFSERRGFQGWVWAEFPCRAGLMESRKIFLTPDPGGRANLYRVQG